MTSIKKCLIVILILVAIVSRFYNISPRIAAAVKPIAISVHVPFRRGQAPLPFRADPGPRALIYVSAVDLYSARLESSKAFLTGLIRVHSKDHPRSTVGCLFAIYPYRIRVVHVNGVRGERGGVGGDRVAGRGWASADLGREREKKEAE